MKRSSEETAKAKQPKGISSKGALKESSPKNSSEPIVIPSFPAKVAAAIERKRRLEKLSRTDYFIRLALKDLFKPDDAPRSPGPESGGNTAAP